MKIEGSSADKGRITSIADRAEVPSLLKRLAKGEELTEREMTVLERTGALNPKKRAADQKKLDTLIDPGIHEYERVQELEQLAKESLILRFRHKEHVRELVELLKEEKQLKGKWLARKAQAEIKRKIDTYITEKNLDLSTVLDAKQIADGHTAFESYFDPELEVLVEQYAKELGM